MDNANRYRLPPFECKAAKTALSEIFDWSIQFGGIPQVWKQTEGEGVTVAVLDTGVDDAHPDLIGSIAEKKDFTGSIFGVRDRQSHGTWCAGMIGARANGIGVRGLMPKCKLLIGKCLGDDGSGSDDMILAAFKWAWLKGADIISMSLGGGAMSGDMHESIRTFTNLPGRFVICAAGNDGRDNSVNYPAKWPQCVAVGAVDKLGRLTSFTSRGPEIDILAPGQDMLSTIPISAGQYGLMSGTSMATPYVAGVAGLALAKHRKEGGSTELRTTPDLIAHLRKTAKADASGYGILNPVAFVDQLTPVGPVAVNPPAAPPIFSGIEIICGGERWRIESVNWKKVETVNNAR